MDLVLGMGLSAFPLGNVPSDFLNEITASQVPCCVKSIKYKKYSEVFYARGVPHTKGNHWEVRNGECLLILVLRIPSVNFYFLCSIMYLIAFSSWQSWILRELRQWTYMAFSHLVLGGCPWLTEARRLPFFGSTPIEVCSLLLSVSEYRKGIWPTSDLFNFFYFLLTRSR
jgi:hypothetical protein